MNEKILKLQAVINDAASSDNEKAVAKGILKKYREMGIDVDSVLDEQPKMRYFGFNGGPRNSEKTDFIFLLLRNMMYWDEIKERRMCDYPGRPYGLQLTAAEFAELSARFDFYWKDYLKQKRENESAFLRAYLGKNELWSKADDKEIREDEAKKTEAQKERDRRARKLQETIDRKSFHTQLKARN